MSDEECRLANAAVFTCYLGSIRLFASESWELASTGAIKGSFVTYYMGWNIIMEMLLFPELSRFRIAIPPLL